MNQNKDLLRKLSKFNPKMEEKYGYLMDKWWKVPEENYVYALAGMRIYTGLATLLWIIACIGIVATTVLSMGDTVGLSIGVGFISLIFTVMGAFQFAKSNQFKKVYKEEREKFENASKNLYEVKNELKNVNTQANQRLQVQLKGALTNAQSLKEFISTLNTMSIITNQAKEDLKSIYQSNKVYDYNLYEAKEIEAFKEVDNYLAFEEESNHLHHLFELISECKTMAEEQNQDGFQLAIEELSETLELN